MSQSAKRLTNLQLELIKLFNYSLNETQLLEVRDMLARYFANQATNEMDKIWNEKGLSNDIMEQWLNDHNRTPYAD